MNRTKTRAMSAIAKTAAVAAIAAFAPALVGSPASADPVTTDSKPLTWAKSPNGSSIVSIERQDDAPQSVTVTIHSASMNRDIPLDVLRPKDTSKPRPTLYLLNGTGGGEDGATWRLRTDAHQFLGDKNINVVTPLKGASSYYTDWQNPDPVLGVNKWRTFLTEEVPPLIDAGLGASGVNAIAGLSTSGTSVFQLAIAKPGLFRGVAAYSGCAQTSDPIGEAYVRTVVEARGGGDAKNMWGPYGGPGWVDNDPYVHAAQLRGLDLYVSNGSGLPGPHDTLDGPDINGDQAVLANQEILGGVIEAATNYCTHNLANRLGQLGIPAKFDFQPTGTHSWGYWQDALKNSWPVLARSMGI